MRRARATGGRSIASTIGDRGKNAHWKTPRGKPRVQGREKKNAVQPRGIEDKRGGACAGGAAKRRTRGSNDQGEKSKLGGARQGPCAQGGQNHPRDVVKEADAQEESKRGDGRAE